MTKTVKRFILEFRKFALKANFIEMVVGIIIGMKFTPLINSLVKDIIMPPFALLTSSASFSDMKWVLKPIIKESEEIIQAETAIYYGKFIEIAIDFFLVAIVMFFIIKTYNVYKSRREDPKDTSEETPKDIELLESINNSLELLVKKYKN